MKKKALSIGSIVVVAVCSALIGMIIATSFHLLPDGKAAPFWVEGESGVAPRVVMPSLSSLAHELSPTVVNIRTTKVVRTRDLYKRFRTPGGEEGPFEDFFNKFFDNMPDKEMEQKSLGSGFIVSPDGYILTNDHVVSGAEKILVSLSDKEEYEAKVIGKDDKTDIALIKINAGNKQLPVAKLGNSDTLEIGDWVMAIGNPFGLGHTVTIGIVSAKARIIGAGPYDNFIQTDAAINPGNSGGPLIDMKGQVIGINTAIVAAGQGIGFAIPINMGKEILPELKETGLVTRGWLGVGIQEVTPEIARAVGLREVKGAMVTMVYPGDPADRAGVKKGDIILSVNGQAIKDSFSLTHLIGTLKPGSKISIMVWREKREIKLATKLEKRIDEHVVSLQKGETETKESKDSLGLTLKDITPEIAQRYRLEDARGVLVTAVDPKGPAANSDIKKDDVIKEINRHEIKGVDDYLKVLKNLHRGDTMLLLIIRDARPFYVAIDIP